MAGYGPCSSGPIYGWPRAASGVWLCAMELHLQVPRVPTMPLSALACGDVRVGWFIRCRGRSASLTSLPGRDFQSSPVPLSPGALLGGVDQMPQATIPALRGGQLHVAPNTGDVSGGRRPAGCGGRRTKRDLFSPLARNPGVPSNMTFSVRRLIPSSARLLS